MTARDEAIDAMWTSGHSCTWLGERLDAIPPDVLARYAIERGGLTEAGVYDSDSADRSGVFYEDEDRPDDAVPLYRVVTP